MGLKPSRAGRPWNGQFGRALLLLAAVLALLFFRSFLPGQVLASTDGPLGLWLSKCHQVAAGFTGIWQDLSSLGTYEGSSSASLTTGLLLVLRPLGYAKFFAPITLLILGVSAWCCFRQWKLGPQACVLGALAAVLNSGWFSGSCWGVGSQMLATGMAFLALAALAGVFPAVAASEPGGSDSPKAGSGQDGRSCPSGEARGRDALRRWARVALAGATVGLGVLEGADIGGLLSIMVAAFALFQAWTNPGPVARKLVGGATRIGVMAVIAFLVAGQGIVSLVQTNVTGVAGMQQDATTRQQHWDWATQWSLPKSEALELFVPGLFGYRMDAPNGAGYWGAAGRDPAWDRYFAGDQSGPRPHGMIRYSGGGLYAGTLVCCLALWALLRSLRRGDPVFSLGQKRVIWFWSGAGLLALLLAFGRFAPFYQWFYALPYVSTVRNPAKFMHIVEWALVILFAYGVDGLVRGYLQVAAECARPRAQRLNSRTGEPANPGAAGVAGVPAPGDGRTPAQPAEGPSRLGLKEWWGNIEAFDKGWLRGLVWALLLSLVGWLIYALLRPRLVEYLQTVDFDAAEAAAVASFSLRQPGWFILFLALSLLLLSLVLGKVFSGGRARLGAVLLGLLLVIDLGRANLPWMVYWDYPTKYATNAVLDLLRQEPFAHRVAIWPRPSSPALVLLDKLYRLEWLQHQFRAFNVQSMDIVQMRSKPQDLVAFETALHFDGTTNTLYRLARRWQVTNTRYLLGTASLLKGLNEEVAPKGGQFRILSRFQIMPRPGIATATRTDQLTAVAKPDGPYALFEFMGALPRARLYSNWQVHTNSQESLDELSSPAFAPEQTVLVSKPLPTHPANPGAGGAGGRVDFVSYAPAHILLQAQATTASVLLLNDRFDPQWQVLVDGHPEELLRCNTLMRGVYLSPGPHRVEFRFRASMCLFYVSLATLLGVLALWAVAGGRPQRRG